MNPPYVIMAFTPEEALEAAQAIKAAKVNKSQRILKPLAPPAITFDLLREAIQSAGIQEAQLIR